MPLTIVKSSSLALAFANKSVLMNLIQRILALCAFILLFWQIIIGAYINRFTKKLGGWVFKFHVIEGVAVYLLVLMHPIFFVLTNYFGGRGLDPFYVFTQVCVLCSGTELFYTLGRVSFWLISITVFAGLFRAAKFHIINYLVFLIIGIHGFLIGTDFRVMPFFAFAIFAYLVVICVVIQKLPALFSFYKTWLNS